MRNKYDIEKRKWTETKLRTNSNTIDDILFYLHFDITNDHMMTSVVATTNEDYIIFISNQNQTIYGFDTDNNNISRCNIESFYSSQSICYLTITRDEQKDTMIVFGWTRKIGNQFKVNLSLCIQKMICDWTYNETLHVVECMTGDHWGISVDRIINSLVIA